MLAGQLYTDIKMAYTGGSTEMFTAKAATNIFNGITSEILAVIEKIFYYDVNSLYPYIMSLFELPCGRLSEYDISKEIYITVI